MIGHPSGLELSRFADGELTGKRQRRVARHLESCTRCRERVAFYRSLRAAAREPASGDVEPPVPPADLAEDVLRRRAAGERIDLGADLRRDGERPGDERHRSLPPPAAGVGRPDHPWRTAIGVAACLLLLAVACVLIIRTPKAAAGHSQLVFAPELPAPGTTIDIRYTPNFELAGYDSLRLRVRARTRRTPNPSQNGVIGALRTVTLYPAEDGTYRGRVRVAPDEVYLAAAVEDPAGEHVDTNLGRLWSLLVADGTGTPATASLESEYRVIERDDFLRATKWASEVTERYPHNPLGWAIRYYHDARVAPAANADSLRAFHEAKLRELLAERADRPSQVDDLVWLTSYARWLGDVRLRDSLFAEVRARDPDDFTTINWRTYQATGSAPRSDFRLEQLETLWKETGAASPVLVRFGLSAAASAHDTAAVERWIERGLSTPGITAGSLASDLDETEYAAERAELRDTWIGQMHDWGDDRRPLGMSVPEFRLARNTRIRREVGRMARDVALSGDTAGAMPLLKWAASDAWRPEMLEPYVARLLATGDTATALAPIGVLMADPVDGDSAASRYDAVVERHVDDPAFFARQSREEYGQRVREHLALHYRFPADTHLSFVGGTTERAGDVLRGQPTIFFLFDTRLARRGRTVRTFARRMTDGAGRDLQGIVVVQTSGGPLPEEIAGAPILVIDDRGYEIAQRLRNFALSGYVVVDRDLTVVASTDDLDTALRVAGAL